MVGDGAARAGPQAAGGARTGGADAATSTPSSPTTPPTPADADSRRSQGVPETLRAAAGAGWRLAVCTNKPERPARKLLEALGLLELLAAVGGGDSFRDPQAGPGACASPRCTPPAAIPAHAVMVGDHHNDVRAARGAGIPCIFAAWGYGPLSMAEGAGADRRARSPTCRAWPTRCSLLPVA